MKRIADQYIDSYNKFDLEGMTRNLHRDIVFKNINDGEVTVELYGKPAFKTQIEQAFGLFKKREMKIIEQKFGENMVENKVDFKGVLAVDVPDGPKENELVKIQYNTVFRFKNGRIIAIEDIN